MRKSICLTFDYELFLGENPGTISNCLISPTDKIMNICKKSKIKTTFFVDVLYLEKMLSYKELFGDYARIKKQLIKMIQEGHRVELHIHPHWRFSTYQNGKWKQPNISDYLIQNHSVKLHIDMIKKGKELLEDICKEAESGYKIIASRAGGWNLIPFPKELSKSMLNLGIRLESSIAPGIAMRGPAHNFNYLNVKHITPYRFSTDPLSEDQNGAMIEFPIATYPFSFYDRAISRLYRMILKKRYLRYSNGTSVPFPQISYDRIRHEMLSLEQAIPFLFFKSIDNYNDSTVTIISHPKGMTDQSFIILEKCVKKEEYRYATLKDRAEELRLV